MRLIKKVILITLVSAVVFCLACFSLRVTPATAACYKQAELPCEGIPTFCEEFCNTSVGCRQDEQVNIYYLLNCIGQSSGKWGQSECVPLPWSLCEAGEECYHTTEDCDPAQSGKHKCIDSGTFTYSYTNPQSMVSGDVCYVP